MVCACRMRSVVTIEYLRVLVAESRDVAICLLGQKGMGQSRVILMMIGLRIHPATKIEMSSSSAIRSIHSTTVWKNMG